MGFHPANFWLTRPSVLELGRSTRQTDGQTDTGIIRRSGHNNVKALFVWLNVFVRVTIIGLSAATTHTVTVYTEIDDVITSGVDLTVRTPPNAGQLLICCFLKLRVKVKGKDRHLCSAP